jgi:ZIP family zinc transporter
MIIALLITLLAGLATSIGGLLATHRAMLKRSYFAVSLAFAAGAMIFVSFVELLPHGIGIHTGHSSTATEWLVYGAFFVGILIVAAIDHFLPSSLNPSEIEGKEEHLGVKARHTNKRLLRSGFLVAIVLALHNFPEGMSTFLAANEDLSAGIALAVAIAIHNIPEGVAVAAPIYAATKSRKKAFWWATLSGFAELAGGLFGVLLIGVLLPTAITGAVFGLVAGMMVFVAIDELLPAARRYQTRGHQVVYGLLGGMAVMAVSLLLL